MTDLYAAARQWILHGFSVIPVADDGSKRPAIAWKKYQSEIATAEVVQWWFTVADYGLGIVTGAVSGQLEMVEFEGRAVAEGFVQRMVTAMADHGQAELWSRIATGYLERTPSGGLHLYYRVDGKARGNTKLARRPSTPQELAANPQAKVQVLMETRGEGGYVAAAPTPGEFHPSGLPWVALAGHCGTNPTITEQERDDLYAIASTLADMPAAEVPDVGPSKQAATNGQPTGLRPGDDYNAKTDWSDILVGWKKMRRFGEGFGWQRPGKDEPGISATTGTSSDGADRLYVFSSSTDFDTERPYSKFAAYAHLHHNGNYGEAAKELKRQGYGDQTVQSPFSSPSISVPVHTTTGPRQAQGPAGGTTSMFDGTAAKHAPDREVEATVHQFTPPADSPMMTNRLTDDGNANAMIEEFGHEVRYCHERGRWLTWSGHRWTWEPTGGGAAREWAKKTARALPDVEGVKGWRNKSLSAMGTTNTLVMAATDPRVVVSLTELDAEPWSLNTPAGVVDLRTGELGNIADHQLHTRSTSCAPDAAADLSVWIKFLNVTFNGDQELIGYMQRLVGYSATGYVGPHVLPFAYGSGGNGKGVFLEAVAKVLGDYATTTGNGFLMAKQHQGHETEIARLAGARMVLCSEVNEADHFDEAKVKQLTGGDTLTARFMRQDHFTFEPTHHLWLIGNHRPAVTSGGDSFWRRCRLIPFLHKVPDNKKIDDLQGILARDHGPAILAWIIAGAVDFAQNNLREPQSVSRATAEYARDQDTLGRFVEEMCNVATTDVVRVEVGVLAAAYTRWCEELGELPVSGKRLSMDLQTRFNVRPARDNRRRWYLGIALNDQAPAFARGAAPTMDPSQPWSP